MFLMIKTKSVGMPSRLICGAVIFCIIMCIGSTISAQDPPLRILEPVDSIIADLKTYIPSRMSEADVPGLSIALIRDNQIVWTEGFGVANRLAGRAVTPETVFEVASISKVITAYAALRLVDQGRLSLDEPVNVYLKKPWLPPSQYADLITMRHLLSHGSGLGDDILFMDKAIRFKPGSSFLYSGVGFMYVQHVIEQVTGGLLEEVARELVFGPLDMPNSSFAAETSIMDHMANGHMQYSFLLLSFLLPFTLILIVSCVVALPANRAMTGSWRPSRRLLLLTGVVVFILTELLLYLVIGESFLNLIWMNIVCALVCLSGMILSSLVVRRLASLLSPSWQRKGGLMTILSAICVDRQRIDHCLADSSSCTLCHCGPTVHRALYVTAGRQFMMHF